MYMYMTSAESMREKIRNCWIILLDQIENNSPVYTKKIEKRNDFYWIIYVYNIVKILVIDCCVLET